LRAKKMMKSMRYSICILAVAALDARADEARVPARFAPDVEAIKRIAESEVTEPSRGAGGESAAAFDAAMLALGRQVDDAFGEGVLSREADSFEWKILALAWASVKQEDRFKELRPRYVDIDLTPERLMHMRPLRMEPLLEKYKTDAYRVAWEYFALLPRSWIRSEDGQSIVRTSSNKMQAVLFALRNIGDPRSVSVLGWYCQMQSKLKYVSEVEREQERALGVLVDLVTRSSMEAMASCIAGSPAKKEMLAYIGAVFMSNDERQRRMELAKGRGDESEFSRLWEIKSARGTGLDRRGGHLAEQPEFRSKWRAVVDRVLKDPERLPVPDREVIEDIKRMLDPDEVEGR
jgi:hypothetical protein